MEWSIIIMIGAVVALFVLAIILRRTKGKRGEKKVAALLVRLPEKEYRVINDLLIQSGGHSTQIDHVVISVYGIFVIETKYYQGWIYGGENSEYWTQNIYGNKYLFRNPLWQNQGHVKTVARLVGDLSNVPIYNIVAFSHQATIKVDRSLPVMYWRNIVPYIKCHEEVHLTEVQADEIYNTLLSVNVNDKVARKQHLASVKHNQERRNTAVANGKCPRCGGNLVMRDGRYGRFYGCSNYPKCKYILK
ncbi:MAG: NERD domain-containing protein [Bacteroidales bacterium]|nr:NERD domain-containing protein [Bacteroidales bacterium]